MSDYQLSQQFDKPETIEEQVEPQAVEQLADSVKPEHEEVAPLPTPEPAQAKNFRQLKEQKQIVERERDEYARRIQELEAQQAPEEDLEYNLGNDDLAEGKHLRKVDSKVKRLEEQLRQYQQQSNVSMVEARLKAQYPDIDSIVSQENLEQLQDNYPEIAQSISSTTDLYAKAVSAYTLIKKLGIAQEDRYVAEKSIVKLNAAKPKPLASVSPQQGDSPLSKANAFANGLSDDLKKQLQKEMNDARRAM